MSELYPCPSPSPPPNPPPSINLTNKEISNTPLKKHNEQ